ncbi:tigger transposable element-derived protein 1-like [Centruroides vittatus]|uniref:tigger transposable element-derived protein 1-like n=1 Tax=Centruroides vittatus TaxID=120091 RepID=UPI00350FB4FA
MAPKHPPPSKSSSEPKKKRKMMTLNKKVNLLDMLKAGHSYASVACHYGLNELTVCYIKKDEVNILWISDCQEKKVSLDTNMIRTKAKALYDRLVPEGELNEDDEGDDNDDENEPQPSTSASSDPTAREKPDFVASKGWFEKFKRRFGLCSIPLYGEASSADQEAALRYVEEEFPKIIDEGGYLPEQVKLYLTEKGLPFKVVLFMDCAGGHATSLHYDGVQVEFLPPNTTFLIQPMDQRVIWAFKALYMRSTMEGLISSINEDNVVFSLKNYWRGYNIAKCLVNIQNALNEMKEQTLIASWRKLRPKNVTHDYKGFTPDEVHHFAVDKAVRLARLVANEGFSDMMTEEVNTLMECHSNLLTDEELVKMTRSVSEEEEEVSDDADDNEAEERGLTLENLQELCNKGPKKSTTTWSEL